jgi:hypothetical protein
MDKSKLTIGINLEGVEDLLHLAKSLEQLSKITDELVNELTLRVALRLIEANHGTSEVLPL